MEVNTFTLADQLCEKEKENSKPKTRESECLFFSLSIPEMGHRQPAPQGPGQGRMLCSLL